MRRILTAFAAACLALPALAQSGMTNITASHIQSDMSGRLLTGKLCLTPVLGSNPTAFTANGVGQVLPAQVCYAVALGVLNISVPDTALANPSGIGYKVALQLSNGFPLYSYTQPIYPTGTSWSLDSWTPTQSASITTPTVNFATHAPTGDCGSAPAIWYIGTPGTVSGVYVCITHVWSQLSSSGGVQADWSASSGPSVILNKPNLATVALSGSYGDLSGKPTIPAAQVPSDWNSSTSPTQILNKPTIPAAPVNADWNAGSGLAQILNKPAVPSTGHALAGFLACADTSASGTAQSCTTSPTFMPVAGDCVIYSTTTANSGTGLTLNVNALGAKSVAKWLGSTTLVAGDVAANAPQVACYTGLVWNLSTLGNPPAGAAQVNSDWSAVSGVAQILNKPTIPAAQVNSDWSAGSGVAQILNKPTIPAAQVNSDWSASSGLAQILNKPTGHGIIGLLACADTSASGTAQSCTTSPTFTPVANDCIVYTTTTANSGTGLTLNVNSLGAKSVAKWLNSTTLVAGDVEANSPQLACYTGTVWNLSVIGNAPSGSFTDPGTTLGDVYYRGSSAMQRLAGPTVGSVAYNLCSTPSGGAATAPAWCLAGIPGRTVTGTTDTIAVTDRGQTVLYTSTSSVAVALPSAATLGNNFDFVAVAQVGSGTITFTAGAGAFLNSSGGSSATQTMTGGQSCPISSPDGTNYIARCTSSAVSILPVANGGTGTSSPSLVAGTNVSISGTWPNQTVTSSAGSGPLTISGTGMTTGNVYYVVSGGLTAAKADVSTTVPAVCYATSATACQINGTVTTTGLTAGAIYYVSDATAGALTATAPTTSGHFVQRFGVALSTTVLLLDPSLNVGGIQ